MFNLKSPFPKIINLILLQTTIVVAIGFNNQAHAQLISESGNLRLYILRSHRRACATGKPQASYSIKGGVSGLLYVDDCNSLGGEAAFYKFVDTRGLERCTGKATLFFTVAVGQRGEGTMVWEVRGAVSGYS